MVLAGLLAVLTLTAAMAGARPAGVAAETAVAPWSTPLAVAAHLPHAARPTLAFTNDGVAHAVWESNRTLYYSFRSKDGDWSEKVRVATGSDPAMVADGQGNLHLVFVNQFMGNYEIYYVTRQSGSWSLPVNVSRTSGYSAQPALAMAGDGPLYATWADNTPGHWVIYYGIWDGHFWSSQPVPNARGQVPALALAPNGTLYLAWQDRVSYSESWTGAFDIFLSQGADRKWLLPVNVSDSADVESLGVTMITTPDNATHLVWVEGDSQVTYCSGQGFNWSVSQVVAAAEASAHGPRIVAERGALLHVVWDEGDKVRAAVLALGTAAWPTPQLVVKPEGSLRDVALASMPDGGIAVGWVQAAAPGDVSVYEARQESALIRHLWLPLWLHL